MKKLMFGMLLLHVCFFRASAAVIEPTANCCFACAGGNTVYDESCFSTIYCNCSSTEISNPDTGVKTVTNRRTNTTCNGNTASASCVIVSTTYSCIEGFYGNPTSAQGTCRECPANATCPGGTDYLCNKGYFYNAANKITPCERCPLPGTTAGLGATDVTDCYIAAGSIGRDTTGTYTYSSDCYYTH